MLELKIKKVKFSERPDATGEPFTKGVDTVSVDPSASATAILDQLREIWTNTFPEMVSWISDPKQLKLMNAGKIIEWDKKLSD